MPGYKHIALALSLTLSSYVPTTWAASSLVVKVFIHDELAEVSEEKLKEDYFQYWLDEMRWIDSNHPVELTFLRALPGITDIDYQALTAEEMLERFKDSVDEIDTKEGFSYLKKNLLLTRNSYDRRTAGIAYDNHNYGIASMDHYGTAGHEIGHMLSATHENAQTRNNGWFCETYMAPERTALRSNCYRYSDANRKLIANYLKYNSN